MNTIGLHNKQQKLAKFIPVVKAVAHMSKDDRHKVGAVILGPHFEIRSTGYNGFPRGVKEGDSARHMKPEKWFFTAHAEENAVAQAARSGVSTIGCTMIITELFPCSTCARLIIQSGIQEVVVTSPDSSPSEKWLQESLRSKMMFEEAGIIITYLPEN